MSKHLVYTSPRNWRNYSRPNSYRGRALSLNKQELIQVKSNLNKRIWGSIYTIVLQLKLPSLFPANI